MKRLVAVLALSVLLAGCVNTVAGIIGESVGVLLGDKVVSSKVEPNVLVGHGWYVMYGVAGALGKSRGRPPVLLPLDFS